MKLNLLAINIGNSHAGLGAFVDDTLEEFATVAHETPEAFEAVLDRLTKKVHGRPNAMCVIGSVHPEATERIRKLTAQRWSDRIYRVEQDLPIAIGRQLDPEAIVGEDRLLNAAAAYDTQKQACAIVDAGTAVTVDFVDGGGIYHGGAILPGTALMLQALARGTAQLPHVTWDRPAEAMGHNTVEAIRSGIFNGLRGGVRELVEAFAEASGIYPIVVATGGDAENLFRDYPLIEQIIPALTVQGIAVTTRSALQNKAREGSGEGGPVGSK